MDGLRLREITLEPILRYGRTLIIQETQRPPPSIPRTHPPPPKRPTHIVVLGKRRVWHRGLVHIMQTLPEPSWHSKCRVVPCKNHPVYLPLRYLTIATPPSLLSFQPFPPTPGPPLSSRHFADTRGRRYYSPRRKSRFKHAPLTRLIDAQRHSENTLTLTHLQLTLNTHARARSHIRAHTHTE